MHLHTPINSATTESVRLIPGSHTYIHAYVCVCVCLYKIWTLEQSASSSFVIWSRRSWFVSSHVQKTPFVSATIKWWNLAARFVGDVGVVSNLDFKTQQGSLKLKRKWRLLSRLTAVFQQKLFLLFWFVFFFSSFFNLNDFENCAEFRPFSHTWLFFLGAPFVGSQPPG